MNNLISNLSETVKYNFLFIFFTGSIAATAIVTTGLNRLILVGPTDMMGWMLLALPFFFIMLIFLGFGCFCGYLFVHMVQEFHAKYLAQQASTSNLHHSTDDDNNEHIH